ncbi:peptidyl-tRNA hydrolase [Actinomadura atramentaria]|uniref:peptidyl-tRNA hydrolase n=1 Tax=Actinomadura atramentaria TaxID=1990 RepID=UPI00037F4522|nr:peptidyl-tRNA hydrolase [Actinomadura atramentaria]
MRPEYDPRDDPPWAMQLVVRVEKSDPPDHGAVCAAAATAVVRLLADPRAAADGPWHDAVREWESRRIRKVARRARGVRWPDVQELPGVTVDEDGAQVRAFVPGPVADVPPRIAKLQVAGLDLAAGEPPPAPPEPYAEIALNPAVTMTTGKAAAQCGHAAHLLLRALPARARRRWLDAGARVRVVRGVPWDEHVRRSTAAVRDGGFTEVPPGTMTAVARLVG